MSNIAFKESLTDIYNRVLDIEKILTPLIQRWYQNLNFPILHEREIKQEIINGLSRVVAEYPDSFSAIIFHCENCSTCIEHGNHFLGEDCLQRRHHVQSVLKGVQTNWNKETIGQDLLKLNQFFNNISIRIVDVFKYEKDIP